MRVQSYNKSMKPPNPIKKSPFPLPVQEHANLFLPIYFVPLFQQFLVFFPCLLVEGFLSEHLEEIEANDWWVHGCFSRELRLYAAHHGIHGRPLHTPHHDFIEAYGLWQEPYGVLEFCSAHLAAEKFGMSEGCTVERLVDDEHPSVIGGELFFLIGVCLHVSYGRSCLLVHNDTPSLCENMLLSKHGGGQYQEFWCEYRPVIMHVAWFCWQN